ncbi:MAG: DUF2922 domain-containing protein [Synergistaceae bacterium]|nr:DUF2922 domain-containing protein [Synergistaceae bacterium]
MKTIRMKFITEEGKNFYVSMDYAAPELSGAEGAAKVKAAADIILEQQPFDVTLISCESAEFIERTSTEIELTKAGA